MQAFTRRTLLGAAPLAALAAPTVLRAQAPIAFRVSSSMPADGNSAHYVWFERFNARIKDLTGGRLRMDFFPNGQLGKEADVVQQVIIGSIDMMITGSSIWATAVPELGALDLGFLFDSYEHGVRALDQGKVGETLGKLLLDRKGVTVAGWGFHFGARCVYTKAPMKSLADLRAVKLRVLPAPAFIETFKLIGAVPAPIPFNELYTALQSGVVDGFEHDAASVYANRLYEVTKHCLQTNHLFSPMVAAMGRRATGKVPAELRDAFRQATAEATEYERGQAASKASGATDLLTAQGITFTPLPEADRRAIQAQMSEKLYAQFAREFPAAKAVFDAVAAARG